VQLIGHRALMETVSAVSAAHMVCLSTSGESFAAALTFEAATCTIRASLVKDSWVSTVLLTQVVDRAFCLLVPIRLNQGPLTRYHA
jgi:hypothetical protein